MWFLQIDTLLILTAVCLFFGIVPQFAGAYARKIYNLMPVVELIVLWYISWELLLFSVAYIIATWGVVLLLRLCQSHRKVWFGILCVVCSLPLIYARVADLFSIPAAEGVFIGLAYNMLKAIDVLYYEYYSGEEADFEVYVNYMLFLPVLTAGPVFRYRDFDRTWAKPVPLNAERATAATKRIIRGLFIKVVLVMVVTKVLRAILALDLRWYHSAVIPLISTALLFFDMSGYADIAIGMGHLAGITVPENFKKPFEAPTFTQFWRNWHVTVSDWIREHVFILFKGKKLTKWHGAALSFTVMMLMALWHGFALINIIDGLLMGCCLAVESIFEISKVNRRKVSKLYFWFRCAVVIYIFSLDTVLYTLSKEELKLLVKGYLSVFGGRFV
ncbi:MAG: MBOAT family O-acyltransferase [Lachnospiraceae bacterium]